MTAIIDFLFGIAKIIGSVFDLFSFIIQRIVQSIEILAEIVSLSYNLFDWLPVLPFSIVSIILGLIVVEKIINIVTG